MQKIKLGVYESAAQEAMAKMLAEGKSEDLIIFHNRNTTDEYANVVAVNAMYLKGLITEDLALVKDWKQKAGLPSDWDEEKYLKNGDHSYSEDPKFKTEKQ